MSAPNDKTTEIQFPENIIEIINEWASSIERGVGVCLLCGCVIQTEAEFIPGTNTHNCSAGRSFEHPDLNLRRQRQLKAHGRCRKTTRR
jgi:hypothetical protein